MRLPRLDLPRESFARAAGALSNEWLVTNGLGGFASGTIAQANTRRYHGLLVASLRPPVERVVMVAKLDTVATYRGERFELACNEFADGTLAPHGFTRLAAFNLEGQIPTWTFALADALLEQRVWMAHGANTTFVSFTARRAAATIELALTPLCTYRDYHSHTQGGWTLGVEPEARGCRIVAFPGARPYRLRIERGEFAAASDWYWRFHHRIEAERGLDANEDLFRPGTFRTRLEPGATITLIASAEAEATESPRGAFERELRREAALLAAVPLGAPSWLARLSLAADQFIVTRSDAEGGAAGMTVIAGYPWFSDWGRDTMTALPGLTLATGRVADAAAILRTFAAHASQGMLPNRFPDSGEAPEYNTVDATLWYFHAIDAYLAATGDSALVSDLYPVLRDIIDWHRRGTRFGIHVDPADGLLFAGEPGVQLTWMDAKVGDWVVTPRIGKPVEINALWHFALERMSRWAATNGDAGGAAGFARASSEVARGFADRFWFDGGGYLYDVVDGPEGVIDADGRRVDPSLRPNQIFAVSLGSPLLPEPRARAVVETCARHLLTPVGLRSLAANHPAYIPHYRGGPRERDAAYHQGTVWSWLLGPYALAHYRVYHDAAHALALLDGLAPHLAEACLGSISEIFEAEAPHAPVGCFAQAWSVAEQLRAWHVINAQDTTHG